MIRYAIGPGAAIRRATAVFVLGFLAMMACESEETMGPNGGALPTAAAGPDLTVSANVAVLLDGSGSSDPDGGTLSYEWSFTARPSGSAAALDDPASERPSFVPDLPGEYRVELVVSNAAGNSPPDDVTITSEDNTTTSTLGAGGGDATSKDGNLTLSIPPGALAEDTEIEVTLVRPSQYPPELEGLDDGAVVYEMQPDGLQFATPARATFTIPSPAVNQDGDLDVQLGVLISVSGDEAEWLDDQVLEVDGVTNTAAISGDITHFSLTIVTRVFQDIETGVDVTFQISSIVEPTVLPVGGEFLARVTVSSSLESGAIPNPGPTQQDASEGVTPVAPFNGSFSQNAAGSWISDNTYQCDPPPGDKVWETEVLIPTSESIYTPVGGLTASGRPFGVPLRERITCLANDDGVEPFPPYSTLLPEAVYYVALYNAFFIARQGGASLVSQIATLVAAFEGVPVAVTPFGILPLNPGSARLVAVLSSGGSYFGSVPTGSSPGEVGMLMAGSTDTVQLTLANLTVPGITDNTGITTDGMPFANDPSAQGWLLTQFEDRNILFLAPNGDDVMVDPTLAEAFYDNGQSVFGSARPVSAFAGPNGFTASDPMLAVTVADDGSGAGEVLKLELVNGVAVASVVDEVFVQPEPRRIRCIQVGSYICAASSFGAGFGGFGGVMFFTWDGQDGFSFIINRLTWAIGIDLIQDGDRVLVASTDFFNNTYAIDELTVDGQYVGFESFPVPEGCVGPGHVVFRSTRDVVISCNTSGLVVGHVFDAAP